MKYKITYPEFPMELPTVYTVTDSTLRYDSSTTNLSSDVYNKDMVALRCDGNGILIEVEGKNKCYLDYSQVEYLLIALIDNASKGGTRVERITSEKVL